MLPPALHTSTQTIDSDLLKEKSIQLQVLRLDQLHPVISGNKLFKLKYYVEDARSRQLKKIVTFGGAYSNHLVATAYACQLNNMECVGIVRGEEPAALSHTLQHCIDYGMQLQFISREAYHQKESPVFLQQLEEQCSDGLIIPEGGYGMAGAKGAADIMQLVEENVTHICCAAGTATTAAGLLLQLKPLQQLLAFPVLKGMQDLKDRIDFLTAGRYNHHQLQIHDSYHFGGYAKKTDSLIQFMNALFLQHQLPTDFVYTAKMMFGVMDLAQKDFFKAGSKICCIHTGGLQGNLSLPAATLTF